MRFRPAVIVATMLTISFAALVLAADAGRLKLDVLGEIGKGAINHASVISASGGKVAEIAAGESVPLEPGEYKVVLPIIGGKIIKDGIKIERGRTTTVLIQNVAVLRVKVKDRTGTDPGLPVSVSTTSTPHEKLASMVSGDSLLMAPNAVDVKVDAPPQGYYWHDVALESGQRTDLTLDEVVKAELLVQPIWSGLPMDKSTRVVIYKAGTQTQIAASEPAPEHRFKLDPGDYDVYVENESGKGAPYVMDRGVRLDSGAKIERKVPLDDRKASNGN